MSPLTGAETRHSKDRQRLELGSGLLHAASFQWSRRGLLDGLALKSTCPFLAMRRFTGEDP
jgi:hypothetical protein